MEMKLSKGAKAYLGENAFANVSQDDIIELAELALTRPSDAMFWDSDLYSTHTLGMYWAPDSDDLIAESNYNVAYEELHNAFPGESRIDSASVGHWTYSSFNCIKVRVINKRNRITPEFVAFALMVISLRDYPLLDDEDYSNREYELWQNSVTEAISDYENDIANEFDNAREFSDSEREYVIEYLSEHYGPGYSEAGWIDPEWITEAVNSNGIELTNSEMHPAYESARGTYSDETLY
jgi:hypothetical protein